MTARTRLADLMAQASPHLPLSISAALQAEYVAVCQTLDEMRELIVDGITVVQMHTLIREGGGYSLRGSYRCVDDCELEQWERRAGALLDKP